MRSLFLLLLTATILMAGPGIAAEADPFVSLNYLTEEFKPYNYKEHGVPKGIAVDLLRLTWEKLYVPEQPIQFVTWLRGYEAALTQPGTVLFSTVKTAERESQFQWAGPIAHSRTVLISRKDPNVPFAKLDDLRKYTVSAVRGYPARAILARQGSGVRIDDSNTVNMCINKLEQGRVDLIAMEATAFRKSLNKLNKSPKDFTIVWLLAETTSYFAFSHNTDPGIVFRFQNALNSVVVTPDFKQLYESYME